MHRQYVNTQWNFCVWKPRSSEVNPHYAFSHHRPPVLPVNNKLFFFVRVNHDHKSEPGLKSSLNMTMLRWEAWSVVKYWLQCKKFRHLCSGGGWRWWGTLFNRSDHGSPWVAACCQATKEIGFVVGEESLVIRPTKMLCLHSESTHRLHSHIMINSHLWVFQVPLTPIWCQQVRRHLIIKSQ